MNINSTHISTNRIKWVFIIALSTAIYVVLVQTFFDRRLSLLLLGLPVILVPLPMKNGPKLLFVLLIFSMSFSARYRFNGIPFRPGGAELAISISDIVLFVLFLFVLLPQFLKKQKFFSSFTVEEVFFIIYLFAQIPSLFVAEDKGYAFLEVLRLVKILFFIYVLKELLRSDRSYLATLVIGLYGVVIFQGLLAISQTSLGTTFGLGFLGERDTLWILSRNGSVFRRAGGTLGHANALGNFFELTIPMVLSLLIYFRYNKKFRRISLCVLFIAIVGAFLTFSRASWGAIGIGILLVIILTIWHQGFRSKRTIFLAITLLFGIFVLVFVFKGPISQRLNLYNESSWEFRQQSYLLARQMIRDRPIQGVGANNFMSVAKDYQIAGISDSVVLTPIHNIFLLIWAETGLVGLLSFLLLVFRVFERSLKLQKSSNSFIGSLSVGVFGALGAFLSHAMLDWLYRYDPIFNLFWLIVGIHIMLVKEEKHVKTQSHLV